MTSPRQMDTARTFCLQLTPCRPAIYCNSFQSIAINFTLLQPDCRLWATYTRLHSCECLKTVRNCLETDWILFEQYFQMFDYNPRTVCRYKIYLSDHNVLIWHQFSNRAPDLSILGSVFSHQTTMERCFIWCHIALHLIVIIQEMIYNWI